MHLLRDCDLPDSGIAHALHLGCQEGQAVERQDEQQQGRQGQDLRESLPELPPENATSHLAGLPMAAAALPTLLCALGPHTQLEALQVAPLLLQAVLGATAELLCEANVNLRGDPPQGPKGGDLRQEQLPIEGLNPQLSLSLEGFDQGVPLALLGPSISDLLKVRTPPEQRPPELGKFLQQRVLVFHPSVPLAGSFAIGRPTGTAHAADDPDAALRHVLTTAGPPITIPEAARPRVEREVLQACVGAIQGIDVGSTVLRIAIDERLHPLRERTAHAIKDRQRLCGPLGRPGCSVTLWLAHLPACEHTSPRKKQEENSKHHVENVQHHLQELHEHDEVPEVAKHLACASVLLQPPALTLQGLGRYEAVFRLRSFNQLARRNGNRKKHHPASRLEVRFDLQNKREFFRQVFEEIGNPFLPHSPGDVDVELCRVPGGVDPRIVDLDAIPQLDGEHGLGDGSHNVSSLTRDSLEELIADYEEPHRTHFPQVVRPAAPQSQTGLAAGLGED
mmetsp:Transcript_69946/g.227695  ORF Transcript_69946/g.227695 Transcript_69946/m.227695 type:complete len:506 (+) Transcript_69946:1889-3406(+)